MPFNPERFNKASCYLPECFAPVPSILAGLEETQTGDITEHVHFRKERVTFEPVLHPLSDVMLILMFLDVRYHLTVTPDIHQRNQQDK